MFYLRESYLCNSVKNSHARINLLANQNPNYSFTYSVSYNYILIARVYRFTIVNRIETNLSLVLIRIYTLNAIELLVLLILLVIDVQ